MAAKKTTTAKAVDTKATESVKKIEAAAPAKVLEAKAEDKKTEIEAAPSQTETETTERKKPGRKPKAAAQEEAPKAEESVAKSTKAAKAAPEKENEVQSCISIQYAGRSYTNEDFMKITRDVWQYDLGKAPSDIKTVDLYVKPEENKVYFVINGCEEGCFDI